VTTDWTEADIPDQAGRTVLITGANSGIGFEAARALAQRGAHVVLACRSHARAQDAVDQIADLDPAGSTEVIELDLADLDSVEAAAAAFNASHDRLDLLINNAGLMATPHQHTAQGHEMQFGVNHLGHFALTGRLLPALLDSEAARVVSISSQAHRFGQMNFDDINSEQRYSPWKAYGQSKLANLLFTRGLQQRLTDADEQAIAVAAHPGGANTNLGHENPGGVLNSAMHAARPVMEKLFTQSAEMGALPTLRAATDPDVQGGDYFGPGGLGEQRGYPKKVAMSSRARDEVTARRLWTVSEELTGVNYAI
jgi:NAD(P)-dependent dehydrogenase (short-subunit alcohol dehydrogenase family)